ncbi:hypothetical protein GHV50_08140 [Pseudomonas aeruginosa]|nr:hypothetical protein [Pseudomonas aeruginosa]
MTKANECTCPSGDGSLRHPCPAHPAVEQAGGDEGAAFNAWLNEVTYEENTDRGVFKVQRHQTLSVEDERIAWRAWQGRALLARSEQEETERLREAYEWGYGDGQNNPNGYSDKKERDACVNELLKQPSPAQAEQAERPEVVARVVHSTPVVLDQCAPLNANDEMMTVAQHAASVARWAEMFNRVEQERDAALARVAELDKQCRDDVARALGLRPSQERGFAWSYLLASIKSCVMASEDAAQAQHSVPAYVSYTTRPAESLAGIALRQLKEESRWVEIRDINAPAFPDMQSHSYYPVGTVIKLPAAAPGKEVGHE